MLAGGMTIAAPSMMPQAAATGSLYVSAENAMFGNTFGGAQIIEVVVINHQNETDEEQGEPIVKVDENQLRMVQGIDGNWYGYFGDSTAVPAADIANNNLNFGTNAYPDVHIGDFNEAISVYKLATDGVLRNVPELSNWNNTAVLGSSTNYGIGQIGVSTADWPFIQLYDLTIENFDVVYEQAGANEVVSLNYDSSDLDDFASMILDRNSASQGSEVHLVITDNQLNIDPTAEDIVMFKVTTGSEGVSFTNRTDGSAAGDYLAYDNNFDDNGKLIINYDANGVGTPVLVDQSTLDDPTADKILVFYEGGENSGIFYNTDDDDNANLMVANYAKRGTTAVFDYNDSAQSLVVANDFGVIDMEEASVGDVWNSGEALTVTLIDQDLNKNSASDEDLVMKNTTKTHLIPSLQIGSPLTVTTGGDDIEAVSGFSKIAYYTNTSTTHTIRDGATANISIVTGYTGTQLDAIDTVNTYFNFDFSAFTNATNTVSDVCLVNATDIHLACASLPTASLINSDKSKGIVEIADPGDSTGDLRVELKLSESNGAGSGTMTSIPFVADVFSFGDAGVNNAIYRILLEETDDNTATFTGSIEYTMLTQINYNSDSLYSGLETIDQDIDVIVEQDMTDEDSLRVNYLDLGGDGVSTQIADQVEAPTHSGVVSFDLDNYKIADTVVVTLDDQDMNEDSELIDVYTTNTNDLVGAAAATDLASGLVLDITFNDQTWTAAPVGETDGSPNDGLASTGFTLVETGVDSGLFTGSFQVPSTYYDAGTTTTVTATGTDIEVNYQDFRNSSGESTEVGDGASINANTGSVAFDRTVYPVPYGSVTGAQFLEHATAGTDDLAQGDVTVHVRVTDADYNVSAMGEDTISDTSVVLKIERGSNSSTLATIGTTALPITEVSPDSGVFE
jgi:hypothetical protein